MQDLVDDRLDRAAAGGRIDLIGGLAAPVPATIAARLIGLPLADHRRLRDWGERIATGLEPYPQPAIRASAGAAITEIAAYLPPHLTGRRPDPGDDVLSAAIAAQEQDGRPTDTAVADLVAFLAFAGVVTAADLIGNAMLALLRNPDAWRALCDSPDRAGDTIEELTRYDSPVQLSTRVAREEMALNGRCIRPGQAVVAAIGAANRDPDRFPAPDRLDLGRAAAGHLGYGTGVHACLGGSLARMEAGVIVQTLARRFPNLHLDPGAPPVRRPAVFMRGLQSLPVELVPGP